MTDIERLRELLALEDMLCAQEGGPTHEDCVRFDYECACFISAHARNLLADYERLRGMEERVKGAAVGEWRGCEQSWKAGGSVEVKFRVLDINYHAPMRVALVPVPGGE
jgi:hypothetical protein